MTSVRADRVLCTWVVYDMSLLLAKPENIVISRTLTTTITALTN